MPGVYVNVISGIGAAQLTELEESAGSCRSCPPTPRTSAGPASGPKKQASIAASRLSDLPRLLEPWRDTVDEVVLVPVRADEARQARDLVDAAIADF